jgi:hypothetical protein
MTFDIDGEQAIELECEVTFRHLEDKKAVRIGRKEYPIHGYHTWVGNMAWDSFLVKRRWPPRSSTTSGPTPSASRAGRRYSKNISRGEDFTAADFEVKE